MNLIKAINNLKEILVKTYAVDVKEISTTNVREARRLKLIEKIEEIVYGLLVDICQDQFPSFKFVVDTNQKTERSLEENKTKVLRRKISFKKFRERQKFAMITFLLAKIHKLLLTSKTCTRRELYYKNLKIFKSQKQVDIYMKDVCYILCAPPWELGVLATSKGLVSGPLLLHMKNGQTIDCNVKGGVAVPMNILDVVTLSSSAEWVLIIEKDTTFHRLMETDANTKLGSCIIITGKGFPDISTRLLICKFWQELQIPILVLNDADPYGFEIMCVYRFGSVSMSSHSSDLACPAVRWLGIHPTDIKPLLLDSKVLTTRDVRKIQLMLERNYVAENDQLKFQLETLLKDNIKAELEALSNISNTYLIDVYVKSKIRCNEYY